MFYRAASMGYEGLRLTGEYACTPYNVLRQQVEQYLEFRAMAKAFPEEDAPEMNLERVRQRYSELSTAPLTDIRDDDYYQVGISRKPAFHEWLEMVYLGRVEMSHCSLALRNCDASASFEGGEWLAFGRQSPMFRAVNPENSLVTLVDNETAYPMFGEMPFKISVSEQVKIKGSEVKWAIERTDELCKSEICDLVSTNCYTVSVNLLVCLYDIVNARHCSTEEDIGQRDQVLLAIKGYIKGFSGDHHGVGIVNNKRVMAAIKRIRVHIPDPTISPALQPTRHGER